MKEEKSKKSSGGIFAAAVFALELFFLCDMLYARSSSGMSLLLGGIILVSSFFFMYIIGRLSRRAANMLTAVFTLCLLLAAAALFFLWKHVYDGGVYDAPDNGKPKLYAGKNVMVLVPHEDDEINLMGGVLEEYVRYGSRVHVVYLTNGDMSVPAERRYDEAIRAMAVCGIPEDRLIFLGYGDSLFKDNVEIYFQPWDTVIESHAGRSQTYGTAGHPAYREGRDYTLNNMYEDLRDVILEYRPDTLFCCGYDEHADHRLLSLLFDRAMGEILRKNRDYAPDVFKGYAYTTAYYAEQDYYRVNLGSTHKNDSAEYMQEDNVFLWGDRLRFPVSSSSLSRSILSSRIYRALACYSSQETGKMADGIINGDKVFWQRETGSALCRTEIEASSGDADCLTDFMLTDRRDPKLSMEPSQNVWIPGKGDKEKTVTFRFAEPTAIGRVKLYDNPSLEDNILDAVITVDGGTEIHTGPLPKNGSGAEFEFGARTLTRLSVSIVESEGDRAGLSEVEAFEKGFVRDYRYLKLMNAAGDFVYDYFIDGSGQEKLYLYIRGAGARQLDLKVSCQGGSACRAKLEDGVLYVTCPEGESCLVTVASADGSCMDTVRIRNKDTTVISLAQTLERYARKEFLPGVIHSNTWTVLRELRALYTKLIQASR